MYGEVETLFLLFELLLHTQPLNSSEQHTKVDLEYIGEKFKNIKEKFKNLKCHYKIGPNLKSNVKMYYVYHYVSK